MPKEPTIFVRVTTLLLSLLVGAGFAAGLRQISVYAPQTGYAVDILERGGVDYVGLTDLLEPLGRPESRISGKKFTLTFNGGETEFQDGTTKVRAAANSKVELSANFLLLDGRGYIPVASIVPLLPILTGQPVEFHAASGRLFVGSTQLHFSAELLHSPSRLVLSFPVPVHPTTQVEKGRVRLLFHREPVVGNGSNSVQYGDPFLLGTSFAELPGGAEFVATVAQPATVSIADGGRTVTIASTVTPPIPPPAQFPPPSSAALPPASSANPASVEQPPAARVRPFVILDAAHGAGDTGAVLSPTLLEKTVNLALARRLQKELEARGISVVLTRVADNALSGDQRAIAANTSHASLYIALHSSASGHGVRVYTALLAPEQPGQGARGFLPWELAQSPYLAKSGAAAATLAAGCDSGGVPVHISAAPVHPLNSVTLAAVAVEVAPLGPSADELASPEYQQKIASALASGIAVLRLQMEPAP